MSTPQVLLNPKSGDVSLNADVPLFDDVKFSAGLQNPDLTKALRGELTDSDKVKINSLLDSKFRTDINTENARLHIGSDGIKIGLNEKPIDINLFIEEDRAFGTNNPVKYGLTEDIKRKFKPNFDVHLDNRNLGRSELDFSAKVRDLEISYMLSADGYSLTHAIRDPDKNFLGVVVIEDLPGKGRDIKLLLRKDDAAVMLKYDPKEDRFDVVGNWFLKKDMTVQSGVGINSGDNRESLGFSYKNDKVGKVNVELGRNKPEGHKETYSLGLNIDIGKGILR